MWITLRVCSLIYLLSMDFSIYDYDTCWCSMWSAFNYIGYLLKLFFCRQYNAFSWNTLQWITLCSFPFKQLLNYFYGKLIQVKLNYAPIYISAKFARGKCSKYKNDNVNLLHMRYVFSLFYDFLYKFCTYTLFFPILISQQLSYCYRITLTQWLRGYNSDKTIYVYTMRAFQLCHAIYLFCKRHTFYCLLYCHSNAWRKILGQYHWHGAGCRWWPQHKTWDYLHQS